MNSLTIYTDRPVTRRKQHYLTRNQQLALIRRMVSNGGENDYAAGEIVDASRAVVQRLGRVARGLLATHGSSPANVTEEHIVQSVPGADPIVRNPGKRGRPFQQLTDEDEALLRDIVRETPSIAAPELRRRFIERSKKPLAIALLQLWLWENNMIYQMREARARERRVKRRNSAQTPTPPPE